MKRHYFVGSSLADIERVEQDLMAAGIPDLQMHVLSNSESELEIHHLHPVADFMKTDIVRSGLLGLGIGTLGGMSILVLAAIMGWTSTIGWAPFVFFCFVVFGFCTWEGGFLGFQRKNREFSRFQCDVQNDKHIFFVDINPEEERIVRDVLMGYPRLMSAGSGRGMPGWLVSGQRQLQHFIHWAP